MNKIFFKYKAIIINGFILISLITAMILQNGALKDFFIGMATGAALVTFGQSIAEVKSKAKGNYETFSDEN